MRPRKYKIDGCDYIIQYRDDLSQRDYTQKIVYDITTTQSDKDKARDTICNTIMVNGSWPETHYQMVNKLRPCMANNLHAYHKLAYNENTETYRYTLIKPYDD